MSASTYEGLGVHRIMLCDRIRNEAFRRAIAATVKSGDVVLDVGAGSGILSLMSAQAGAAKVFAVEQTGMAVLARRLIAVNGLRHRIEVIQSAVESIRLPTRVDVIVSEWLGMYGVDENMLAPVLLARDRWLKPGGKLLPGRVTALMAPISHPELSSDLSFLQSRPYDLDFGLVARGVAEELYLTNSRVSAENLLAEPQELWTTDSQTDPLNRALLPFRGAPIFQVNRPGDVAGLTAWFRADFGSGIELTNALDAAATHWAQLIFPLERPIAVSPGDTIATDFLCIPAEPGFCHHAWSVRVRDGHWEHHDTRRAGWQGGRS